MQYHVEVLAVVSAYLVMSNYDGDTDIRALSCYPRPMWVCGDRPTWVKASSSYSGDHDSSGLPSPGNVTRKAVVSLDASIAAG